MKIHNFCRAKTTINKDKWYAGEVSANPIIDKGSNLLYIFKISANQYEKNKNPIRKSDG